MKDSYYAELAVNIQHYMSRGNSLESALRITLQSEEEVHRVYQIIQEQKRCKTYTHVDPFAFLKDNAK